MKIVELFAGIGGFRLGFGEDNEYVFVNDANKEASSIYEYQFKHKVDSRFIQDVPSNEIPEHDLLCGGFPCQPFSQAGKRLGFTEVRGNLFGNIMDILEYHKPEFVILENVQNLKNHDNGNTWKVIQKKLSNLYDVKETILSPHQFGIPQHRFRIYIVGKLKSEISMFPLEDFEFPEPNHNECDIKTVIDESTRDFMHLRNDTRNHLHIWQEFLDELYRHGAKLPSFPIWAMEFGANYDYEELAPAFQSTKDLKNKKGKFGAIVKGNTIENCLSNLPNYARTNKSKVFPTWKIQFIKRNREFYEQNKEWLDLWLPKIKNFENSHQKFEWNCGTEENPTIFNKIIQFRPSGIRVKKPTFSPALVLTTTQIPIFPWVNLPSESLGDNASLKGRYMTVEEAASLQGMKRLKKYPETIPAAFKAFGNAVNVDLVKKIVEKLINHEPHRQSINCASAECI
jgi:DNA (cytosine-5)-methyltransferase 1